MHTSRSLSGPCAASLTLRRLSGIEEGIFRGLEYCWQKYLSLIDSFYFSGQPSDLPAKRRVGEGSLGYRPVYAHHPIDPHPRGGTLRELRHPKPVYGPAWWEEFVNFVQLLTLNQSPD